MKVLSTEMQTALREFIESIPELGNIELMAQVNYWSIELKPKRTPKMKVHPLNTEEGVIEQAYAEHTS